ncbi:MAG: XTP/dITP diphosphohydrolase, partial [Bacteroidota bacterium]|nr:XTP/dITP diphosphohydrolase [Bacteroidota bacterium]
ANRSKILELMKNIPSEERTAQFRTIICLKSAGVLEFSTGYCRGLISTEERGDYGFGYDSLFIPEGFEETFAEMDPELKNALSHRSMAASNLVEILLKLNF